MANSNYLWGIDLGGTKIEGVILIPGKVPDAVIRMRIPSEAEKGYEHLCNNIRDLVTMLEEESGLKPERIGFGTPGILDPLTQTMKNCNSTCLNGRSLKMDLEKMLGVSIEIANDANCFALAETLYGIIPEKAPDARVVFGVILGTGVGGGIVAPLSPKGGFAVWNGKHGIAGEWGHNLLEENGEKCYCGKRGCVETVISGPALEAYYKSISGKTLSLKEIHEKYKLESAIPLAPFGGLGVATLTINRLVEKFGKAIAQVINILDPDAIVLGGGVGNIEALYTEGPKEIQKHLFNNKLETPILKPKLGDSAGVFGAASL